MTVYLDVVFIENLIMNYIILYTTGIVLKNKMQHGRILIASFFGASYAIITYLYFKNIQNSIIAKIIFSILMVYIAFNSRKVKKMFKELLIFYLTTFSFGGITFFLLYVIKPKGIVFNNGIWIGEYYIKIAILGRNFGIFYYITFI